MLSMFPGKELGSATLASWGVLFLNTSPLQKKKKKAECFFSLFVLFLKVQTLFQFQFINLGTAVGLLQKWSGIKNFEKGDTYTVL